MSLNGTGIRVEWVSAKGLEGIVETDIDAELVVFTDMATGEGVVGLYLLV
jgi:hypothetical protein